MTLKKETKKRVEDACGEVIELELEISSELQFSETS
jgi:hypothetical protein